MNSKRIIKDYLYIIKDNDTSFFNQYFFINTQNVSNILLTILQGE